MYFRRDFAAAAALPCFCAAVDPAAVYDGGYGNDHPIFLGIGNGGAGQSGLIEGKTVTRTSSSVWCFTYNPEAEQIAIDQGIA